MSWVKENKFLTVLLATVVLIGAALAFFGISNSGKYQASKDEFDDSTSKMKNLGKGELFPSNQNADAKKKAIDNYAVVASNLQKAIISYSPENLNNLAPAVFTDQLKTTEEKLLSKFAKNATIVPEGFHMGFERYFGSPAKSEATGKLSYQLKAIEWLLDQLADARPSTILNVYREELPIEKAAAFDMNGKAFQEMPIELGFIASAPRVRKFLSEIANSKEFFFEIDSLRLASTNQEAPSKENAEFTDSGAAAGGGQANDDFDDFNEGFEDSSGDETSSSSPSTVNVAIEVDENPSEKILIQVLGDEEVVVYLSLDLLLFNRSLELPK